METAQLLGNIGEFVGSIAVLVTLIYLTVQIRHSTAAVNNQVEQESSAWWYEFNQVMTLNPEILEIFQQGLKDIEPLSDEERRRFVWFVASSFYRIMGFHKAWISGHLSDDSWKPSERYLRTLLEHPAVDIWWRTGFFNGSDEFVAYIEGIRQDVDSEWEYVDIARAFDRHAAGHTSGNGQTS